MPEEAVTQQDYGTRARQADVAPLAGREHGDVEVLRLRRATAEDDRLHADRIQQPGVLNVDLFAIERNGGKPIAPLGTAPVDIAAGDVLTVSVVIQNKGIGHTLVPEQRDFYECWVEFQAKDAAGNMLMDSGAVGPNGALDPTAHSFTNRLVNTQGTLNDLHQVWADTRYRVQQHDSVGPVADRALSVQGSGRCDRADFDHRQGELSPLQPALHRLRRWASTTRLPEVEITSRTRTLALGPNPATPPDPADNPVWMRWNNYGIGLLDAQQYADSEHAFEQVVRLRPDYADAYTNVAIADFSWQRYDGSRTNLEKALQLAPHNARALYYLALVDRIQGHPDAAVADLLDVITQFPRSRDAHRELGFSFYQQHKYQEARTEYETVQSIDPDDLSAHYILSIVYRRLGMKAEAAREAAAFADQKDDPTANSYALEFLSKHPEVTSESVPWHVHSNVADDHEKQSSGQGGGTGQ